MQAVYERMRERRCSQGRMPGACGRCAALQARLRRGGSDAKTFTQALLTTAKRTNADSQAREHMGAQVAEPQSQPAYYRNIAGQKMPQLQSPPLGGTSLPRSGSAANSPASAGQCWTKWKVHILGRTIITSCILWCCICYCKPAGLPC